MKIRKILKNNKVFKKLFLNKLSRKRRDDFLKKYASDLKTLEIGAKSKGNKKYFPNISTLNIESGDEIDFVANAENLENIFSPESFDVVLCLSVLEHTENPQKVVDNIRNILNKNGIAIISAPFIIPLHETPNDFWRFTKYGLIKLFEDFELVEINDDANSLEAIGYLYNRLFFQKKSLFMPGFWLMSKINYLFGKILKGKEYGHFISHKNKVEEKNILANNILAVFRKKQ